MTNAKKPVAGSKQQVAGVPKLPFQGFSKFSKGASFFGQQNQANTPKGQFKPPAPRITQNKGGGGK